MSICAAALFSSYVKMIAPLNVQKAQRFFSEPVAPGDCEYWVSDLGEDAGGDRLSNKEQSPGDIEPVALTATNEGFSLEAWKSVSIAAGDRVTDFD